MVNLWIYPFSNIQTFKNMTMRDRKYQIRFHIKQFLAYESQQLCINFIQYDLFPIKNNILMNFKI
jgi:hypothetical protein